MVGLEKRDRHQSQNEYKLLTGRWTVVLWHYEPEEE